MLFGIVGTTLAVSWGSILPDIWHDAKTLLRHMLEVLTSLEQHRVAGIPLDRLLHFFLAAAIFMVAARFLSRWLAALVTLVPMLLKETVDIPAKLKFLRTGEPLTVTTDSAWDIAAGLLGLAAGVFVAALLGERWRVRPRETTPRQLPSPGDMELRAFPARLLRRPCAWPRSTDMELRAFPARLLYCALGLFSVALLAGHSASAGRPLTHVVVAAVVVLACRILGPANVTIFAVPGVPLLIWFCNEFDLHTWWYYASDTLVLTLFVYVLAERLVKADFCFRRLPMDSLVALYALFAVAAVAWSMPEGGMTFAKGKQLMCVASGLAVYFLVVNVLHTRAQLQMAAWVLAIAVGVICGAGVIELFTSRHITFQKQPGSVFGGAEKLSVYATMMGPFVLSLAAFCRSRWRWLFALVAALAAVIVVVTASRSAWAGGVVSVVAVCLFALWRRDWVLGVSGTLALALLATLVLATLERAAAASSAYRSPLFGEVLSLSPTRVEPSFNVSRGRIWELGIAEVRERPIFGRAGTENNRTAIYLNLAVDNGVIAGASLLAALLWVLFRDLRLGARIDEPLLRASTFGFAFGLIGVLVTGIGIGWAVRRDFVPLLWYIIALGPAMLAAAAQTKPEANASKALRVESAAPRADESLGEESKTCPPTRTYRMSFQLSERMILLAVALAAFGTAALLLWLMFR